MYLQIAAKNYFTQISVYVQTMEQIHVFSDWIIAICFTKTIFLCVCLYLTQHGGMW